MKTLNQLLKQPLARVPNKLVILLIVIAVLGFADATYLTVEHYQGVIPPCSVVSGCETVLTSSYSVVAGIPVSLGGSIYYFLILVGLLLYIDTKKEFILKWTLFATILGLMSSLWFLYVQAFILHAYCLYCLGSAVTSILLFVLGVYVIKKYTYISDIQYVPDHE
jgi:uncharacterized membrane protein